MDARATVQVDNRDVRVTRWRLAVGEETGEHRHEYRYVVVPISGGVMRATSSTGEVVTSELVPGVSYFREAGAQHNVRNDGQEILDFVEVEILTQVAEAEGRS